MIAKSVLRSTQHLQHLRQGRWMISEIFLFFLFSLFCVAYPIAVIGVTCNVKAPFTMGFAGNLMLLLEGSIAGCWIVVNQGTLKGLGATAVILVIGFLAEYTGVTTGFPFGRYTYTSALFPKVFNVVPLAVLFAWVMVIISSVSTARYFLPQRLAGSAYRDLCILLLSSSLALVMDFLIEPVATQVQGYWIWSAAGLYYGVPPSNFAAWLVVSLLMISLTTAITRPKTGSLREKYRGIPLALYLLSLLMFALINLSHAFYLAAFIGAVSISPFLCWGIYKTCTGQIAWPSILHTPK